MQGWTATTRHGKLTGKLFRKNLQLKGVCYSRLKVGLSPYIESPLKMKKNAFCFILKALFVLKIFNFLSWLFGHVEKQLDERG